MLRLKIALIFLLSTIPALILIAFYAIARWVRDTHFELYCLLTMLTFVLLALVIESVPALSRMSFKRNFENIGLLTIYLGLILSVVLKQSFDTMLYVKPRSYLVVNSYKTFKSFPTPCLMLSDWQGYNTIEDAIRKGGESLFGTKADMQNSTLMKKLFPAHSIIYTDKPIANLNLDTYNTIVFFQYGTLEFYTVNQEQIYQNMLLKFSWLTGIENWRPSRVIPISRGAIDNKIKFGTPVHGLYIVLQKSTS